MASPSGDDLGRHGDATTERCVEDVARGSWDQIADAQSRGRRIVFGTFGTSAIALASAAQTGQNRIVRTAEWR